MASVDPITGHQDLGQSEEEVYKLNAFTSAILTKRDEAVSGRQTCGIETEWQEDEEGYQGVDDANRGFTRQHVQTPKRSYAIASRDGTTRSTVFLNITRPYTDAAAARVADMLVPSDDRPWGIQPTPIPSLNNDAVLQLGGPEQAIAMLETHKARAAAAAKAMQDEIDDVLNECRWHAGIRHLIEDCARLGSGCIKGPYPVKRAANIYRKQQGVSVLTRIEDIKPSSKRIDPWNLFPDPACGESLHDGGYVFEREFITKKQLRGLLGMPGYMPMEIMKALKEGPKVWGASHREAGDSIYLRNQDQFDMWLFHGTVEADDMRCCGVEVQDDHAVASAMCVLVNDHLIKATLNVLDTGEFPYDIIAWQRRARLPWGMGVPRQINTPQRMLNAGAREMMDNAGVTASPQIVIGNGVTPADGKFEIRGRKLWRAEADVIDVRQAFHGWVPPSVQAELMAIIQFALKMAEDTTGLPMLLQGQSPEGRGAETLGGMQLLQNNASGVMRRLAKRFDDQITSPHIGRYYDWMMQHSDKEEIKGDFEIDVRASSALVERDAQQQFLLTAAQFAKDPAFEISPARLFSELCKGARIDPKRVQLSPEEKAVAGQAQPDPVAEARAALDQARGALADAQAERTKIEAVNKRVEAMFSASQSAALMAQNPAVAPIADQLLNSAGLEDQDQAPLIPEVPAQVSAGVLPEENTSPNFPARPLNPGVGLNQGIEGGANG